MDPQRFKTHSARAVLFGAAAVSTAVLAGCLVPPAKPAAQPTQVDRLMQMYPELRTGRLLVIADFEDPKHAEIFQLTEASSAAKIVVDGKQGREETGRGCLRFSAAAPSDTIAVNNSAATQWYLKRDWRPYDLLLMSIHSPARDLTAEIAIAGGPAAERMTTQASIPLQRGWNVVRLDLAEIGERIPLDDVQEIRLSVTPVSKPLELLLDDVLLTGYREDLLGDSQHRDAGLYVQRVGRRWKIGAAGPVSDFELTFANGQIVEWFNVASDPYRLQNLVRGTTLGPSPIVLGLSDQGAGDFSRFGKVVVAKSRIIELNPVRAVITCEWRFAEDSKSAQAVLDERPFQRWVYTIYPSGQIYVAIESTAKTEAWSPEQLGLAVTLAFPPDTQTEARASPENGKDDRAGTAPAFAVARNKPTDALLLYTMHETARPMQMTQTALASEATNTPPSTERTSFVATGGPQTKHIERWASHILLASSGKVSDDEARARAIDYAQPVAPRLEVGSLAALDQGQSESPGFDPASGCHVIVPDRGCVRFTVDGRRQQHFSPVFQIMTSDSREAWVYVDHLIFERAARDTQGNLVFQLPGVIDRQVLVEVLFRNPERPSGS